MKRFCLAALVGLYACNQREEGIINPIVQDITESVYASGIVKSKNQYELFSTVNGIIAEILVAEGDTVQKGDIIIALVNETQELSSENARLAATYSSTTFNIDRLNEVKVNVDLAQAKMQNDSALFQRQNSLWNQQIGTQNDLEQRELAWKASVTTYQAALLQYNSVKKEIEFKAQQSMKNLQITNSLKNDYTVKARQAGRVYNILKQPGEMVNTQTPIAVIGDMTEFVMELQVDEYDIGKIKPGQKVFVSMDTYQEQVFEATVTKIQPIMDDRSRSFEVEASFTSRPPHLYPKLTVEANILISTKKNALTIPRTYLIDEHNVLLKNGERRKVVTGLKDYQRVEIMSGLSKDDHIKMLVE
jgi:multidrug efflux pump subunit AcrA (membrane-fusion protein)